MQGNVPMGEHQIGVVTHYWNHLGVAGVHLDEPVDVGDHIHVVGHTTDFEQDIGSLQVEHHDVRHANSGEDVGIRVADHVREHDAVYKLEREDLGGREHEL